jgi:hypothetical protein
MTSVGCPDDLLVELRRGTLSRGRPRALDAHLLICAECRMSAALGRAVGPLPSVDAADEAMAARLVARTLAPRALPAGNAPPAPRPGVRAAASSARSRPSAGAARIPRWAAVAAGLALLAGAASAAVWRGRRLLAQPPRGPVSSSERGPTVRAPDVPVIVLLPPSRLAPPGPALGPAPPVLTPPGPALGPPSSVVASGEPKAASSASPARPPRRPARADLGAPSADAATVFRDANEARRGHRLDEARRGYELLQARFPESPEATLSHLSLGNLELARGAFASALVEFDAYVAEGASDLAEEALVGKARALAGLGRAAEERETWHALEARYPSSEYRFRARDRLRALDAGDRK